MVLVFFFFSFVNLTFLPKLSKFAKYFKQDFTVTVMLSEQEYSHLNHTVMFKVIQLNMKFVMAPNFFMWSTFEEKCDLSSLYPVAKLTRGKVCLQNK